MRAWLIAWLLGLGTCVGCLLTLMLHHLVHGRWGELLRPALEAGARSLPWWALGFVPLALGTDLLYIWTDAATMAADASLRHKAWYLCSAGYVIRSLMCLVLWSALAIVLAGKARPHALRPGLATLGLILVFPTATLTAVDWVASLDPHFSSSMFGQYVVIGQIVAGLSAAIMITLARDHADETRRGELRNLLLAALMLWGYVAFAQYLLVWSGDLPFQIRWYQARGGPGPWPIVLTIVVIVRGVVALPGLLTRALDRHPRVLALLAGLLFVTYLLELYWLVLPAQYPVVVGADSMPALSWLDVVLPLVVAAGWTLLAFRMSRQVEAEDA
jgi:hypothetical protein